MPGGGYIDSMRQTGRRDGEILLEGESKSKTRSRQKNYCITQGESRDNKARSRLVLSRWGRCGQSSKEQLVCECEMKCE
jgi:hypothetical protein